MRTRDEDLAERRCRQNRVAGGAWTLVDVRLVARRPDSACRLVLDARVEADKAMKRKSLDVRRCRCTRKMTGDIDCGVYRETYYTGGMISFERTALRSRAAMELQSQVVEEAAGRCRRPGRR